MRVTDMLGLALSALRQQKSRTMLTTLGVVFGSLVLAASLSIGQGVQQAVQAFARSNEFLRHVEVYPDWDGSLAGDATKDSIQVQGVMSETRRDRLRTALVRRQARTTGGRRASLSRDKIASLGAIKHVETVLPMAWQDGYAILDRQGQSTAIGAVRPDDAAFRQRIVAGRPIETSGERGIVVSEVLLYVLGVTDEAAVERVLGKTLRLECRGRARPGLTVQVNHPEGGETSLQEAAILAKVMRQLPALLDKMGLTEPEKAVLQSAVATGPAADEGKLYGEDFTIVGVMRGPTVDEDERWDPLRIDGDVVLGIDAAASLFLNVPGQSVRGMHRAALIVDQEENVKGVLDEVRGLGFDARAPLEHLKRQRLIYLLIFGGMTCVAVVALVVAAMGIANTMLISVLERTREIGIMKAVGADSRHLQFIFLVEGAIIGCVGGALGLLAAWCAAFPADAWIRSLASGDLKLSLKGSLFVFPGWLIATVLCVAVTVTILAAVYPSRRAAGIDPVAALRHE